MAMKDSLITSTITRKGQTTVPVSVRKVLGLSLHQRLAYRISGSRVTLEAVHSEINQLAGALAGPGNARDKAKNRQEIADSRATKYLRKGAA